MQRQSDQKPSLLADYFDYNLSSESLANYSNPDLDDNDRWGPKRDSLYIVVPITLIYALIFVTGVIGNVSTCVVISRNKSMHTATNYYLFSLAVSDLVLLVSGLPPEMYYIWSKYPYIFGEPFCVMQGFAAETSANATVLTITAFTIERYVAICHPFLSHTMSKLSRAIKFVMAIWVLAMCFAVPQAMAFGIIYEYTGDGKVDNNHYICSVKRQIVPHAFELSTLVFFVAPMSLISVLYILIAIQLRRSRIVRKGSQANSVELKHRVAKTHSGQAMQTIVVSGDGAAVLAGSMDQPDDPTQGTNCQEDGRKNYHRNMHNRATKHVVNMLVAVVVAFFICWAPFHAQRLLAIHAQQPHRTDDIIALYKCLTYLSGVLYYLSTCINPFLYNIMSNKFRNAFRETLSRYIAIGGRSRTPARRYSTLSLPRSISPTRSQSLSHSGGVQSRSASLRRGRDSDMARRPLVVSFRKPRALPSTCIHAPRCTCRINYNHRQDRSTVEETCIDAIKPPTFNTQPKGKLFRKWGRKKHIVNKNVQCKVICSECHRHLSNDSELHNKLMLSQEYSTSSSVSDSKRPKDSKDSMSVNIQLMDDVQLAESDLIPHHRCPNQQSEMTRSPRDVKMPNGFVADSYYNVSHSKTMPDIVKYTIHVKRKSDSKKIPHIEPITISLSDTEEKLNFEMHKGRYISEINASCRKWGSVENLPFDVT